MRWTATHRVSAAVTIIAGAMGCVGADRQERSSLPDSSYGVPQQPASAHVMLTEADNGRTVDAVPGQQVVIRLSANHTTGYRWILATPAPGVFASLGEATYEPDTTKSRLTGAGGFETWNFQAARPGRKEVRFEYRRTWERDKPAARSVRYTIQVR